MASSLNADNGVVSGSAGLKSAADSSGVLALQSNGTTGLTLNTSLALGVGSSPSYGTSGQVLTSSGSGAAPTWSSPSAGIPGVYGQVFTSSDTFTIPAGVNAVKVTLVGGGGGGGYDGSYAYGGGGGATAISYLTSLTPGSTIVVTVGAAGTGSSVGTNGGNSVIASGTQTITTVTAGGGQGGQYLAVGGTATNGTINISGGMGVGSNQSPNVIWGGGSSLSPLIWSNSGSVGYGGGGVGSSGNGRPGIVIFEW